MEIKTTEQMKQALRSKLRTEFGSSVEEASDERMLCVCALVLRDVMAQRGQPARDAGKGAAPGALPVDGIPHGQEPDEKRLQPRRERGADAGA